ncbi:hypothetical protein SOVF_175430 [Spinacia oleracea]|nr:hypothetical protein SOVF_175430 [Spinacia oleracea]
MLLTSLHYVTDKGSWVFNQTFSESEAPAPTQEPRQALTPLQEPKKTAKKAITPKQTTSKKCAKTAPSSKKGPVPKKGKKTSSISALVPQSRQIQSSQASTSVAMSSHVTDSGS